MTKSDMFNKNYKLFLKPYRARQKETKILDHALPKEKEVRCK